MRKESRHLDNKSNEKKTMKNTVKWKTCNQYYSTIEWHMLLYAEQCRDGKIELRDVSDCFEWYCLHFCVNEMNSAPNEIVSFFSSTKDQSIEWTSMKCIDATFNYYRCCFFVNGHRHFSSQCEGVVFFYFLSQRLATIRKIFENSISIRYEQFGLKHFNLEFFIHG